MQNRALGTAWEPLGALLGASWSHLEHLGASWKILKRVYPLWEASLAPLRPSSRPLGASGRHLRALWELSGGACEPQKTSKELQKTPQIVPKSTKILLQSARRVEPTTEEEIS